NVVQEAAPEAQPTDTAQPGGNLDSATSEGRSRFGAGPGYGGPPGAIFHGPLPNFGPQAAGRGMYQQQEQVFVDPYKLFRFVDLTAEPGKTYRYQVKLLLNNPNFNLASECLDPKAIQAGSDKKKYVESEWKETPAITVPHEFQIL